MILIIIAWHEHVMTLSCHCDHVIRYLVRVRGKKPAYISKYYRCVLVNPAASTSGILAGQPLEDPLVRSLSTCAGHTRTTRTSRSWWCRFMWSRYTAHYYAHCTMHSAGASCQVK